MNRETKESLVQRFSRPRNERNSSHLSLPILFFTFFVKYIPLSSMNFGGEAGNLDLPLSSVVELWWVKFWLSWYQTGITNSISYFYLNWKKGLYHSFSNNLRLMFFRIQISVWISRINGNMSERNLKLDYIVYFWIIQRLFFYLTLTNKERVKYNFGKYFNHNSNLFIYQWVNSSVKEGTITWIDTN